MTHELMRGFDVKILKLGASVWAGKALFINKM